MFLTFENLNYKQIKMKRKDFLKSIIGTSAFLGIPLQSFSLEASSIEQIIKEKGKEVNGSMFGFSCPKISKVRIGIIGLGNRGSVLLEMFQHLVEINMAEIIAISDIIEKKVRESADKLSKWQSKKPSLYFKSDKDWKKLVERDDIDLVIIATPWDMHAPMSIYSMENGKHVACEVPISCSIEECWKIIQTAEKTRRHCMMMENCNYNEEELWVLNMIDKGIFEEYYSKYNDYE